MKYIDLINGIKEIHIVNMIMNNVKDCINLDNLEKRNNFSLILEGYHNSGKTTAMTSMIYYDFQLTYDNIYIFTNIVCDINLLFIKDIDNVNIISSNFKAHINIIIENQENNRQYRF